MAAGVGGNILVGAACLLCLLVLVGGLTPVIDNGIYINDVTAGMPAQAAGLMPHDVLVSIDNVSINNSTMLRTALADKTAGDTVQATVLRGEGWHDQFTTTVNLTVSDNKTVMGVSALDLFTQQRLDFYRTFSFDKLAMYIVPPTLASGLTPFSDTLAPFYTHWLGSSWAILANVLFWLWFINFNLAIFNALPIYPMDGGRIFHITLKRFAKGLSEKAVYRITLAVTGVCVTVVALGIILPFIL
jgi:membrane-associated protease RseP (regulator of RpoE activity)